MGKGVHSIHCLKTWLFENCEVATKKLSLRSGFIGLYGRSRNSSVRLVTVIFSVAPKSGCVRNLMAATAVTERHEQS